MKYRTIVADPPWYYPEGYRTRSRTPGVWTGPVTIKPLPYPSMRTSEICGLQVSALAARNCRLFLWTTNAHLEEALSVLKAWGFQYRQTVVWHKRDANMGGTVAPSSAEFLLVATIGSPHRLKKWASSVVTTSAPKQHSRKPDVFLDLIEQVSPGPYLELFARRTRLGWDTWGNEALNHVALDTGAEGPLALERTE